MKPPADDRTLRVLEYPKVLSALAEGTVTSMGRSSALSLLPSLDATAVAEAVALTGEAAAVSAEAEIPLRGARDLEAAASHAAAGGVLDPADLLDVAETLAVARRVQAFLRERRQRAPGLAEIAERLAVLVPIEAAIERSLDAQGRVRDTASQDLRRIREEMRAAERRLREALEVLVRESASAKYMQEPLVTVRSDRFVVPVKAEHRAQVPGIVHDTSASGATLFVEPSSVVPLGNRRRELASAEREEVLRILRSLSAMVGDAGEALRSNGRVLGELDLASAKAALSARLRCSAPEVRTDGLVRLLGARHPLLLLTGGEGEVVPIDVELGRTFSTLVVTGPNTGGKTVALKTVGLLTLMTQSGLHITAAEGSAVAVFDQIHADIGDEQSIEQSLSTFSSHMGAIVQVLRRARPQALVLLDEVGAGTDPTEGVALARAVIEALHGRGLRTIVTTHYNELKMLASTTPGIENASVEFDAETLRPTFRLRIGLPGRSNALLIAQRLGLDGDIVTRARDYLTPEQAAIEQVLADLTRDRQVAERDRREAATARAAAEEAEQRLSAEAERLRGERRHLLADARRASEAIVEQTRRRLDALMSEVRAARSEAAVRQARERLREVVESLPADEPPAAPPGPTPEVIEPGQEVFVVPLGLVGKAASAPDPGGQVEVEVGGLRARVPADALREPPPTGGPARPGAGEAAPRSPSRQARAGRAQDAGGVDLPERPLVSVSISVRGQTVDEALVQVDRYLDEAVRARLPQVVVIHGKGTGALRRALHQFLRGHPHVRQFRLGERGEGDTGATVITLAL